MVTGDREQLRERKWLGAELRRLAGPSGRECTEIYGPNIGPGRVAEQKASQLHTHIQARPPGRLDDNLTCHSMFWSVVVCSCSATLILRQD